MPPSEAAAAVLAGVEREDDRLRVWSFFDSNGIGAAFRRACERARIADLRFSDLRHEAASRLAQRMPVATLAKVMVWKALQMSMRYDNPTEDELVKIVRGEQ